MGLFSSIAGAAKQKADQFREEQEIARLEALRREDLRWTFHQLEVEKSFAKCKGYAMAMQSLLNDVSDNDLKRYYEEAYQRRNVKGLNVLRPTMERHGYSVRDENGNWINPKKI